MRDRNWLQGKLGRKLAGNYSIPQRSDPCPGPSMMRRQKVRNVCHLYVAAIFHALINAYLLNNKPASGKINLFSIIENEGYIRDSILMTGEDIPIILSVFNPNVHYTLPVTIIATRNDVCIRFVLDLCVFQGGYISMGLATDWEAQGIPRMKCNQKVCSAMSNCCKETFGINFLHSILRCL